MVVTSFKNEQVRFLKSLSQKKYREEHRVFFAEGLNVVSEGIKSGADVRKIVFSESFASAEGFRKMFVQPDRFSVQHRLKGVLTVASNAGEFSGPVLMKEQPQCEDVDRTGQASGLSPHFQESFRRHI